MTTKQNIEFKAYYENINKAVEICESSGFRKIKDHRQIDKYYSVPNGRLKIRDDGKFGTFLIFYERLNISKPRPCYYAKVDISINASEISKLLDYSLHKKAIVEKHRKTFETDTALINIDTIKEIGNFIEIEVMVEKTKTPEKAAMLANNLKTIFKISEADIVAFSYADLLPMQKASTYWRNKLNSSPKSGKLFLIDGCSCSGKTTLSQSINKESDINLKFVPRYCTRGKRKNEETESEYIFISQMDFRELASKGTFIEYSDFEFGMSYGLPWRDAIMPLLNAQNALGVINLGNIMHVKKILPEAITILVHAPIKTIRKRLEDRGYHNDEQIDERLFNARTVEKLKNHYDFIIENDDGLLEQSRAKFKEIIKANSYSL